MAACSRFPSNRLCRLRARVTCLFCRTVSQREGKHVFPVMSTPRVKHMPTKMPVPLPVCLGIASNLQCHRLFALVAYACVTKSAFMFLFKFTEDKIAGGVSVNTCSHAALVAPLLPSSGTALAATEGAWSRWLNLFHLKVCTSLLNIFKAYF